MAQIVIFAPPGTDTSAGEEALKGAGHDVQIVEAKPENLLQIVIGMIETPSEEGEEETTEEPAADADAMAGGEAEAAEASPEDELAAMAGEEPPEKLESLGICAIDGDNIQARLGKKTALFVTELQQGEKLTFMLNESVISTWEKTHRFMLATSTGKMTGAAAPVFKSKFGKTYLVVGPELHQYFS